MGWREWRGFDAFVEGLLETERGKELGDEEVRHRAAAFLERKKVGLSFVLDDENEWPPNDEFAQRLRDRGLGGGPDALEGCGDSSDERVRRAVDAVPEDAESLRQWLLGPLASVGLPDLPDDLLRFAAEWRGWLGHPDVWGDLHGESTDESATRLVGLLSKAMEGDAQTRAAAVREALFRYPEVVLLPHFWLTVLKAKYDVATARIQSGGFGITGPPNDTPEAAHGRENERLRRISEATDFLKLVVTGLRATGAWGEGARVDEGLGDEATRYDRDALEVFSDYDWLIGTYEQVAGTEGLVEGARPDLAERVRGGDLTAAQAAERHVRHIYGSMRKARGEKRESWQPMSERAFQTLRAEGRRQRARLKKQADERRGRLAE